MKAKEILRDIEGCLSHYCMIRPPGESHKGMFHSGPCACVRNSTKMGIVLTRLHAYLREQ